MIAFVSKSQGLFFALINQQHFDGGNMKTLINLKLKTTLWKRNIKQIDLALNLKIDPSLISKIINGRAEPTPEIKREISKFLGMDERELF